MNRVAVLNIVGLSQNLLKGHMPFFENWMANKSMATISPAVPAVTCTSQTNYLTGKTASEHGIVGNGWKFKDEQEIKLWRQSNHLVQSPSLWEEARERDPNFTVANLFWWYNMYSSADFSVTPRPQYYADGRKAPDCYSHPPELRDQLQNTLGTFPLFRFWGPATSIQSTQWIANAAKEVFKKQGPTLNLVYLPHLDYCLQKFGTGSPEVVTELGLLDLVLKDLISFYEANAVECMVLSEYGITPVKNPIHINRVLRKSGYVSVRTERETELPDVGASKAFALADHQIAHVYIRDKKDIPAVKSLLSTIQGIQHIYEGHELDEIGLAHDRSGELVVISEPDAWFTYYYWLDDRKAPDFARCVDIHRKPGYDPVELFAQGRLVKLKMGGKLIAKKLGFRSLMNVIPLDATLVKGSHGSPFIEEDYYPIVISRALEKGNFHSTEIKNLILNRLFQTA